MRPTSSAVQRFLVMMLMLSSAMVENASSLQAYPKLLSRPLVGGPSFLRLHVQVQLNSRGTKIDFLPKNATDPMILLQLLTLNDVPGEVRIFTKNGGDGDNSREYDRLESMARTFVEKEYAPEPTLHLITNNCWTFAFRLVEYLKKEEDERSRLERIDT